MIRGRFLSRGEWERILTDAGAAPLSGKGALNTAEWWRLPGGAPFTVPVENEAGEADYWAVQTLREQLRGNSNHN
jgi:hypothetical protein